MYRQPEIEFIVKWIDDDNFMATTVKGQYGCGYSPVEAIENLGKVLAPRPGDVQVDLLACCPRTGDGSKVIIQSLGEYIQRRIILPIDEFPGAGAHWKDHFFAHFA